GHLVPRSGRDSGPRAEAGDRSSLRGLSAPQRRCVRARQPRAMVVVTAAATLRHARHNWLAHGACHTMLASKPGEETLGGNSLQRYTLAVLSHVGLVVAWYLFVKLGEVPKFVMPSPYETVNALLVPNYRWLENIAVTGTEIFGGFILAVIFGIGAALLFSW